MKLRMLGIGMIRLHQLMNRWNKGIQIALFIYMGAASGNWSPGDIQDPDSIPNISDSDAITHSTYDIVSLRYSGSD
jgi:hypothetical protein